MARLPSRAARWLAVHAADPYRRQVNSYAAANVDRILLNFIVVTFPIILAAKSGGRPGLLLLGGCGVLLSAAVLAVMRRRPSAYIANREAFIVLPALLVPLLAIRLNLADVFGHLQRHGGSPLRLLGLLLLSHPGTWVLISALCGGAAIAANVLVLPVLALPTVWASRGMCQQVLHVPGVEEPLARLHGALDTLQ
ncbi:hypothetical protein COHA_007854 [Chlorella ohadii]|uniref:Uncharacterized protein n=1 Tax=Chlorella ohadii TaxID=2649997 RepID=A0AAD5DHZ5_9CHLO|nr:hypothetical protein COHA_007854 [Chlorella ohadii]